MVDQVPRPQVELPRACRQEEDFHRDRGYIGRRRRKDLIVPLVALKYSTRLSFLNFRTDIKEDSQEKVRAFTII